MQQTNFLHCTGSYDWYSGNPVIHYLFPGHTTFNIFSSLALLHFCANTLFLWFMWLDMCPHQHFSVMICKKVCVICKLLHHNLQIWFFNLPCKCNHTQQVNLEMSHTIGIIVKSHVPCWNYPKMVMKVHLVVCYQTCTLDFNHWSSNT